MNRNIPAHVKLYLLTVVVLLAGISTVNAQHVENLLPKANHHYHKKHFKEALPLYLQIEKLLPSDYVDSTELYYQIACSYFYADLQMEKSIPYFEKFLAMTDTVYEPHYFLGQMYHYTEQFDKALEQYTIFKRLAQADSSASPALLTRVLKAVNKQIASCNNGKVLKANPIKAFEQNLGDTLNTEHSEYAPAITTHEERMVFTRRSPETTGGKLAPDGDYFEDVYICDILEGRLMHKFDYDSSLKSGYTNLLANMKFSPALNLGGSVNSALHEGGVTFSSDSKKLFIYKNMKVWVTEENNGAWQPPHEIEGLSTLVNKHSYEPSISLSADENTVYVACDQAGGYGGLDLYRSVKVNGVWSPLENLGPQINTPDDEDSPYIDPDNKHLFFSSKGHSTMGGYDIFRTTFDGKNWSVPSNLGYPVNSPGDDIFFVMPLRYNRGYFSSNKMGGYGKMDLYRVTFADLRPTFAEVRGLVLKGNKFVPTFSTLSVLDPWTNEKIAKFESDSANGDYLMLLGHGKDVLVRVETPGFAPVDKNFKIPPQVDFFQFYQEIHHMYIRDKDGKIIGQMISMFSTEYNSRLIDSLRENDGKLGEKFLAYLSKLDPNDSTYKHLMLDVKYYFPEDSIAKMMSRDTTLRKRYPPGTEIAFATNANYKDGDEKTIPTEYKKVEKYTIDKTNNFIVIGPAFGAENLEKLLTATSSDTSATGTKLIMDVSSVPRIVVLFEFKSTKLSPDFYKELDLLVGFMKKFKNYSFEISGHTDSIGNEKVNVQISKQRAVAAKAYMVKKGIAPNRITVAGKGKSMPIAPNTFPDGMDNPEGRKSNRRIEFRVTKK